jgi:hypothetical protein
VNTAIFSLIDTVILRLPVSTSLRLAAGFQEPDRGSPFPAEGRFSNSGPHAFDFAVRAEPAAFQSLYFWRTASITFYVSVLLLMCYGLFRIASTRPRLQSIAITGMDAAVLSALQIVPVCQDWPGPIRQPYERIANDLRELAPGAPVYTTWEYGISEPVSFYLRITAGQRLFLQSSILSGFRPVLCCSTGPGRSRKQIR